MDAWQKFAEPQNTLAEPLGSAEPRLKNTELVNNQNLFCQNLGNFSIRGKTKNSESDITLRNWKVNLLKLLLIRNRPGRNFRFQKTLHTKTIFLQRCSNICFLDPLDPCVTISYREMISQITFVSVFNESRNNVLKNDSRMLLIVIRVNVYIVPDQVCF